MQYLLDTEFSVLANKKNKRILARNSLEFCWPTHLSFVITTLLLPVAERSQQLVLVVLSLETVTQVARDAVLVPQRSLVVTQQILVRVQLLLHLQSTACVTEGKNKLRTSVSEKPH